MRLLALQLEKIVNTPAQKCVPSVLSRSCCCCCFFLGGGGGGGGDWIMERPGVCEGEEKGVRERD